MGTILTTRDLSLLGALTHRVRTFSLEQIARTWWSEDSKRAAEGRLRRLASEGLLDLSRELAHPELNFEAPVVTWAIGEDEPDLGGASFKLQSRWREEPKRTLCASATTLAANRFGGYGGRPPRAIERTHDLHLARVFLLYRDRHPELISAWVYEEQVKAERRRQLRRGPRSRVREKLPDAFLRLESSTRVIEFGGAYDKEKLRAFHQYCVGKSYPYEIW